MWQITRSDQTQEISGDTNRKRTAVDSLIVMLTEDDMFELADFMVYADVSIDDGLEFGLVNEMSFAERFFQSDTEE